MTWACLLLGAGAALLLVFSVSAVALLDDPRVTAELERVRAEGTVPDGYGIEQLRELTRWVLTTAAVVSIPVIVFAAYAARGDRVSRVALTVLAAGTALLLALGGVAGLLLALTVAAAAALLWTGPARTWYAGVQGSRTAQAAAQGQTGPTGHGGGRMSSTNPPPGEGRRPEDEGSPPPSAPSYGQPDQPGGYGQSGQRYGEQPGQPPADEPQSYSERYGQGSGQQPDQQQRGQQHGGQPQGGQPQGGQYGQQYGHPQGQYGKGYGPSPYPRSRPGTVTAAAVITMVMSVLTGGVWLVSGIALLVVSEQDIQEFFDRRQGRQALQDLQDAGYSESDVTGFLDVGGGVLIAVGLLMLAVVVPAVFLLRGSSVARVLVTIASATTLLIGLFFTVTAVIGIVWVVPAAIVLVLLFVGDAGSWFAGRKARAT